jgi:pyrimidine operon attenuation protein / uracil phosphoribosyltransferase
METARLLIGPERFALTIERLSHQLLEEFDDFHDTCLVAIQTGGAPLSERIYRYLIDHLQIEHIDYGKLDITFYRDDFRRPGAHLRASENEMNFVVENKKVILVDDVLYTGRTVQAALTALNHYGRPKKVDLLTMVDRRFNRELPIRSTFTGMRIDAVDEAYVQVEWAELQGQDRIVLVPKKY